MKPKINPSDLYELVVNGKVTSVADGYNLKSLRKELGDTINIFPPNSNNTIVIRHQATNTILVKAETLGTKPKATPAIKGIKSQTVLIPFKRYYDKNGNPTCATCFKTKKVCSLLRFKTFGTLEICGYTGELLERNNNGVGYLQPIKNCIVWNLKKL